MAKFKSFVTTWNLDTSICIRESVFFCFVSFCFLFLRKLVRLPQVLAGRGDRLGHSAGQSGLRVDAALHADRAGERRRRGGNHGEDPRQRAGCQRQPAALSEGGVRRLAEGERAGGSASGTNQGNFNRTPFFFFNVQLFIIHTSVV